MNKLYIPVSSLNFNSIFSSESISPASFFSNRGFGYKRYTKVEPNPFDFSILLYDHFPIYTTKDFENENYPIVIEVPKDIVPKDSLRIESKGISIYQVSQSIYLSPEWTRFIFINSKEQKSVLVKSEQSLETKFVKSYANCFTCIDKLNIAKFNWSFDYIREIKDLSELNQSHLVFDQSFNKIKGFIYGYSIGAKLAKPKGFVELQNHLREIKNITSGLINIYGNYLNTGKNLKSKTLSYIPKPTYYEIQSRLKDLKNRTDNAVILLKPFENIEENIISNFLAKYKDSIDINLLLQIFKEIRPFKWSFYEQLEYAVSAQNSKVTPLLNRLVNLAYSLFLSDNGRINQSDSAINELSEVQSNLEKNISIIEASLIIKNTAFDFANILFIAGLRLSQFLEPIISPAEQKLYQLIINSLLPLPHETSEGFRHSKSDIIFGIGKELRETTKDWQHNPVRNYLNNLLESIESLNKPFNIHESKSLIWRSFAAFFIRGEEPDKLIDFLISNGIEDYRFGLGMWGAYFGFANMPRTISDVLANNSDFINQQAISDFIVKNILSYEVSNNTGKVIPEKLKEVKEPKSSYPISSSKNELAQENDFVTNLTKTQKPKLWKPEFDMHVIQAFQYVRNLPQLTSYFDFKEFRNRLKVNKPKGFGDAMIDFSCDFVKSYSRT